MNAAEILADIKSGKRPLQAQEREELKKELNAMTDYGEWLNHPTTRDFLSVISNLRDAHMLSAAAISAAGMNNNDLIRSHNNQAFAYQRVILAMQNGGKVSGDITKKSED